MISSIEKKELLNKKLEGMFLWMIHARNVVAQNTLKDIILITMNR